AQHLAGLGFGRLGHAAAGNSFLMRKYFDLPAPTFVGSLITLQVDSAPMKSWTLSQSCELAGLRRHFQKRASMRFLVPAAFSPSNSSSSSKPELVSASTTSTAADL